MNRKKIFTVVTARASATEQRQLLEGVISQAFEMNTDIIVISNIYNASEYNKFITLENSIYDRIISERPDGIIITDDSFMNKALRDSVTRKIKLTGKPCISIGTDRTGFETINTDTSEDMRMITDHLIELHGFNDIDFLTGPEDSKDALDRLEGFRRSLENHGLEFSDDKVIYGDFWVNSGEKTALEYIEGKRKMPQALVCANDYMAYAFCDTMTAHGVKIPDEISVTGYEYIGERTEHYPVLTTWQRNRGFLGRKAVSMLSEKISGSSSGLTCTSEGRLITGDTCPCGTGHNDIAAEIAEKKKQAFYSSLNDTGMLEQFLTESQTINDLISALRTHSYFIPDVSGLFLCLYDEWCVSTPNISGKNTSGKADTVLYSITDNYYRVSEPVHFSRDDIFPDEILNPDIPNAYYCCPVYFMDENFGYMIVRYDKVSCFGESFRKWTNIAANALEFLRMKNDISYLMSCQNLSEYRDTQTGMSNREGLVNEMNIALRNEDADAFFIISVLLDINTGTLPSDTKKYESDRMITEGAGEVISKTASFCGKSCGRISDSVFVISGASGKEGWTPEDILEKLNTALYGFFKENGIYGDSICHTGLYTGKIPEDSFSSCLEKAEDKNAYGINENDTESSEYLKLEELRSGIYLNPEKKITAEDACRKLCISSGYFRAVYKKHFGDSFHKDCIALKARYAKYCLVSSGMNIATVSEKCGFETEKYFMQQFRRITGYTPGQYRKKFTSVTKH